MSNSVCFKACKGKAESYKEKTIFSGGARISLKNHLTRYSTFVKCIYMVKSFYMVLSGFICLSQLCGEIMILKNGERLEVEVISKNEKEYVVNHFFSKGIKQKRVVPVAEVHDVRKGSILADKEYEKLQAFLPVPDGKTVDYYDALIDDKFVEFAERYPDFTKENELKATIESLKKERAMVQEGKIKKGGKFISPSDFDDRFYDYEADQIADRISNFLTGEKRSVIKGLREYDVLTSDFLHSGAYGRTVPLVEEILGQFKSLLENKIANPDKGIDKEFLKTLSAEEAVRVETQLKENMMKAMEKIEQEKQRGEKWLSVDFTNPDQMKQTVKLVDQRLNEISEWKESEKIDGGKLYTDAYNAMEAGNKELSMTALEDFKDISPSDLVLQKLQKKFDELSGISAPSEKEDMVKDATDTEEKKLSPGTLSVDDFQ